MKSQQWRAVAQISGVSEAPHGEQLSKLDRGSPMSCISHEPGAAVLILEWVFPFKGTIREAVIDSEQMARRLVEFAGLPGVVSSVSVSAESTPASKVLYLGLMDLPSVADWFEVTEERVLERVREDPAFPQPVAHLGSGPVFMGDQVRRRGVVWPPSTAG